ncbi:MAG: prepilin-type N-terminal cleavage/methylation domain-containing protein [Phycisphaerae bacterium]|nr:prepilin-type N-terminal cleavage/methylation domain-containing protein [Phycisphaerae bacterium]
MDTRRGFTLVELLVVISILAVLMAILMPSLRQARDQARRIHCISNVRALTLGWLMYKDEHSGRIVFGGTKGEAAWVDDKLQTTWEDQQAGIRRGRLFKYVGKEPDVYRCPADPRKPSAAGRYVAFRTFSIPGGANGETWGNCKITTLYSQIRNPVTKYVFVEELDVREGGNMGSWQLERERWVDAIAMWHHKKTTLAFADGHAETRAWRDRTLIEWTITALNRPQAFSFGRTPEHGDRVDFDSMVNGYPAQAIASP